MDSPGRGARGFEESLDPVPGPVSGYQKPVSGYQKPVLDPRTGPQTPKNAQVGHQGGGQNRDTQFLIAGLLIARWGGVWTLRVLAEFCSSSQLLQVKLLRVTKK